MRKFHDPSPIRRRDADDAFLSDDPDRICDAMVAIALYDSDWKWVQDKYLHFLVNKNPDITRLAATCLGHIARIHGKLEKQAVLAKLRKHLENQAIADQIEDAIEDIERFV